MRRRSSLEVFQSATVRCPRLIQHRREVALSEREKARLHHMVMPTRPEACDAIERHIERLLQCDPPPFAAWLRQLGELRTAEETVAA
jgi:hypothetical protein